MRGFPRFWRIIFSRITSRDAQSIFEKIWTHGILPIYAGIFNAKQHYIQNIQTPQSPRRPFDYKPQLSQELEIIGLILWATQGYKTQLSLSNGNPSIIGKYLEFLRTVCDLKEEKIKAVIHCHDTLAYESCLAYWSEITKISHSLFTKPHTKSDRGGKRKYLYGILGIVASNKKLVHIFKERLEELGLPRDWARRAANCSTPRF